MPNAVALGPLLIPVPVLGLVVGFYFMPWVLGRISARLDGDAQRVKRLAQWSMFVGIVAARLGFVVMNWQSYAEAPWTVLFFWQPGYSAAIGIVAAILFATWRLQRTQSLGGKQTAGLLAGAVVAVALGFYTVAGLVWVLKDRDAFGPGSKLADFVLEDLNSDIVRWSDLKGKVVLVNFWATWCPPCRREMPLLDSIHRNYESQGFSVVGIAVGESKETVRTYVDSIGLGYPVWTNSGVGGVDRTQKVFDSYGGAGLPTTLFVDRQGIVRERYVGELSLGFVDSEVKKLLSETR